MKNMRKWVLSAAVVAAGLGLGATAAQAAEFGVYVHGPVAHVPPCPGAGYAWEGGRWNYVGYRGGDHYARFDGRRDFDRNTYARRDFDRRDNDRRDDRGRNRR